MWIDIHAHLNDRTDSELSLELHRAFDAQVGTIIATATDLASSERVIKLCAAFPQLYGCIGISPFDTQSPPADWYDRLVRMLDQPRIIALGEIGLDATNPLYPPLTTQRPFFERQISLAIKHDIPAVVHSRGMESEVADLCKALGAKKVLFHCYTGDIPSLQSIIDYGYYVSFSGIITFSQTVQNLLTYVPAERLFIETDTPYLAPKPHRGKRNTPAFICHVGEAAAAALSCTPQDLQATITRNFERFFNVRLQP